MLLASPRTDGDYPVSDAACRLRRRRWATCTRTVYPSHPAPCRWNYGPTVLVGRAYTGRRSVDVSWSICRVRLPVLSNRDSERAAGAVITTICTSPPAGRSRSPKSSRCSKRRQESLIMSGLWQFVVPADCTNLFTNPSGETATTGFTANGGSIARTVGAGRKGAYGIVHTPSNSTSSGIYRELSLTQWDGLHLSAYVKMTNGVPGQFYVADASGTPVGTPTTFTGDGTWHRYSVAYTAVATATHRMYLAKNGSSSTANIQSDGWMLHTGTELQTYVDGDQPGCVWTSTAHASTSYRLATSQAGGVIRNLDDYAMYVEKATGYGEPPYQVNTTEYGSLPGALYDSTRARPRSLQLALKGIGTSLSNLHSRARQPDCRAQSRRHATPRTFPVSLLGPRRWQGTAAACGAGRRLRWYAAGGLR